MISCPYEHSLDHVVLVRSLESRRTIRHSVSFGQGFSSCSTLMFVRIQTQADNLLLAMVHRALTFSLREYAILG